MVRLITISGLSYTGTTSLAIELAKYLKWQFISAGNRFRDYCEKSRIDIVSLPLELQFEFDNIIINEISKLEKVIIEGRYLGYFAKKYIDVLKVSINANFQIRIERCREREEFIKSDEEASKLINVRDKIEKENAKKLYEIDDFMNPAYYDLILHNNNDIDFKKAINIIAGKL